MDMGQELLRAVLSSLIGTLGFALLLHAPRNSWLIGSVIGGVAYGIYWVFMHLGLVESAAIFLGAFCGSLMAQVAARRMKMIATIYITLSILSIVPGLGLYRMMAFLGEGKSIDGIRAGVEAMSGITMIALGIAMGSFLFRALLGKRLKYDKFKTKARIGKKGKATNGGG